MLRNAACSDPNFRYQQCIIFNHGCESTQNCSHQQYQFQHSCKSARHDYRKREPDGFFVVFGLHHPEHGTRGTSDRGAHDYATDRPIHQRRATFLRGKWPVAHADLRTIVNVGHMGSNSATTMLTVTAPAGSAALRHPDVRRTSAQRLAGFLALPIFALVLVTGLKNQSRGVRGVQVLLLLLTALVAGCGGGSGGGGSKPGTTSYTGAIVRTVQITVNVNMQ